MSIWHIQPLTTEGLPQDKRPKDRCWAVYDDRSVMIAVTYDHDALGISGLATAQALVVASGHEPQFVVGERCDLVARR